LSRPDGVCHLPGSYQISMKPFSLLSTEVAESGLVNSLLSVEGAASSLYFHVPSDLRRTARPSRVVASIVEAWAPPVARTPRRIRVRSRRVMGSALRGTLSLVGAPSPLLLNPLRLALQVVGVGLEDRAEVRHQPLDECEDHTRKALLHPEVGRIAVPRRE